MDPSFSNKNVTYGTDPGYGRTPYIQSWNFNLQRQLFSKIVIDAGYVGRKGTALRQGGLARVGQIPADALAKYGRNLNNTIRNAADAAANGVAYPYPGFTGTVASALRPFPQLYGNSTVGEYGSPLGFSTYHAMQVTANRQFSKGLTVYANYVWSKTMTNTESSDPLVNAGRPLDYYNLSREKAIAEYDLPHMFKGLVTYQLPLGRGRKYFKSAPRVVNAVIGGWSTSIITNYFSGTPLAFAGSMPLANGWNGAVNRANIAAGDLKVSEFDKSAFSLSNTNSSSNTYLNKSNFSDPAPLTLGTSAFKYTQARNFGTINEDIGLQKNHKFGERMKFQLRAEFLNTFNRHNLGGIVTNVTSPSFGQVTTVTGNRTIQLGTRFDF